MRPRSLCPSPSRLGCRPGFKLQASVTEEQRTWLERLSTAECLSTDFAHAQIGKRGHVVREARQKGSCQEAAASSRGPTFILAGRDGNPSCACNERCDQGDGANLLVRRVAVS